jgi:hypothetical protein
VKCWASVCFGGTGLLVLPIEWPAFFPSVGNLTFFFFVGGTRALLLPGGVRPLSCVGREASRQKQISKAWSLRFTWVCDGRLLALCSKLRVPARLELFGVHQEVVPLGST